MSHIMMMRRYWQAKVTQQFKDPHYALCPMGQGLKPQDINTTLVGEHVSVVFVQGSGIRTYAFEGQKNRDRFVNHYRAFGARPCGDPLKTRELSNARD